MTPPRPRREPARAAAPSARDEAASTQFVERLGSTLTDLGMQRVPSRVFAALMADEDGRMTSAELATALRLSPASISGAVRYLTQMRMIHREREVGTRKDVYVIAADQWHDTLLNTDQIYGRLAAAFAEGIGAVGGPDSDAGRRVSTSVEFLEFIIKEMAGIADRWDRRRA
jgi:predicted transcriptional regulator